MVYSPNEDDFEDDDVIQSEEDLVPEEAAPKRKSKKLSGSLTPEAVMSNLEKSFGKNFIKKASALEPKNVISTGYKELDEAIGIGGIPLGIIIELYGPEASGKGVLSMSICRSAQEKNFRCLWVDAENQCNKDWMEINGLDLDKIDIMEAFHSGEDILDATESLVKSGVYKMIVVDSLAALVPEADQDRRVGESQMGVMGKMMSNALRRLGQVCAQHGCTMIFINQIRSKIGVMFGNPETTPGGKAVGHYASLRIRIQKTSEKIEKEGEQVGIRSKVKIMKNRFGMPFKEAIVPIYYQKYNPSPLELFVDFARKCKAIRLRKGNYFFDKLAAETPLDVVLVVQQNNRLAELAEKIIENCAKEGIKLEDQDEKIINVINSMKKEEFSFEAFN